MVEVQGGEATRPKPQTLAHKKSVDWFGRLFGRHQYAKNRKTLTSLCMTHGKN